MISVRPASLWTWSCCFMCQKLTFLDTVNVITVKLCKMIVITGLYPFTGLSVPSLHFKVTAASDRCKIQSCMFWYIFVRSSSSNFRPLTVWVIMGTWGLILFQSFLWEAIVSISDIGTDMHPLTSSIQHFFCQPWESAVRICPEGWFWRGCCGVQFVNVKYKELSMHIILLLTSAIHKQDKWHSFCFCKSHNICFWKSSGIFQRSFNFCMVGWYR